MKKINVTQTFLPPLEEYSKVLEEIWSAKHLTNRGPNVLELESKIQNYLSSYNTPLLVSNGTIALQIAIKALNLKGEIITTPFSYVATTSSIVWEGCKPIFVDIHPEYLTIDETKIEEAITKNTSAILATHVYGNPCNIVAIEKIAKKFNLKVIYDAAHCFGVKYNNKSIFDYGDISTCSFHATKIFHTGEGGAVFAQNQNLFDKIKLAHSFGHIGDEHIQLGINGKMSELSAAMGLSVLGHIESIIMERKKVDNYYKKNLDFEKIKTIRIRKNTEYNYSYFPIIFDSEKSMLKCKLKLEQENIFPRRYFYPSLNQLKYLKKNSKMLESDLISKSILCLPNYFGLKERSLIKICSIINNFNQKN